MKNGMKTKWSQGKISHFLQQLKTPNREKSNMRGIQRRAFLYPHSTKVGAGDVTARRRLPVTVLHKRDHRSNEIIGYRY